MIHTSPIHIWLTCVLITSIGCTKNKPTQVDNQKDSIEFSGYTWIIKNTTTPIGPGPNYWNSKNVWTDTADNVHVRLDKNATDTWTCAEMYSRELFGYGTYQFWVEGKIGTLDKNVVLGLFTYSGNDGYDEVDIECAQWGVATTPNLSYTVWPAYNSNQTKWTTSYTFSPNDSLTTERFIRTPTSVIFQSLHGFHDDTTGTLFTATSPFESAAPMQIHINLWLYRGMAPSDGKEVEIIIHRFMYVP